MCVESNEEGAAITEGIHKHPLTDASEPFSTGRLLSATVFIAAHFVLSGCPVSLDGGSSASLLSSAPHTSSGIGGSIEIWVLELHAFIAAE